MNHNLNMYSNCGYMWIKIIENRTWTINIYFAAVSAVHLSTVHKQHQQYCFDKYVPNKSLGPLLHNLMNVRRNTPIAVSSSVLSLYHCKNYCWHRIEQNCLKCWESRENMHKTLKKILNFPPNIIFSKYLEFF